MTDDPLGIGGGESTPAPSTPDPLGIGGGESQSFSTYAPDKFQPPDQPAYKDQSLMQRIQTDYGNRNQEAQKTGAAYQQGQISKPEEIMQLAGKSGAGFMNDVLGETVKSGANELSQLGEYLNPKSTADMKQKMNAAIPEFVNSDIGKAGIQAFQTAGKGWDAFKQDNPRAAINIESLADLGMFTTVAAPASEGIISAITKPKLPGTLGLDTVNSGDNFLAAVKPVQDNYKKTLAKEDQKWGAAEDKSRNATMSGALPQSLPDKIEQALFDDSAVSLNDDNLKALKNQVDKFGKYQSEKIGVDQSGELPTVTPAKNAQLSDILAIRRGISTLAKKSTDGNVRYASGIALRQVDDELANHAANAIISGDKDAWSSIQDAIDYSRQKFQKFGTNRKAAESNMFEKIVTKSDDLGGLDNGQIIDAFGTTTKGQNYTGQMINRMLDNAGSPAAREEVRSRLARGFVDRAIEKASPDGLVVPGRLRTELSRLIQHTRAVGGMDTDLRNVIFTKDDIKALKNLRDNMKDANAWDGTVRQMAGTQIPFGQQVLTKSDIAAQKSATRHVEDFLTQRALGAQAILRGSPYKWGRMLSVGTADALQNNGTPPTPTQKPEQHSQIDGNLLDKFAQAETSGGKNMVNPNSNATGILQFEPKTWNALVKKYGKDYGITTADIKDPAKQYIMGALNTQENAAQLSKSLGRNPTNGELYMAHVFGPSGAEKLIASAGTDSLAKDLYPAKVVRANRNIFFDKMRPRSAAEVYAIMDNKIA